MSSAVCREGCFPSSKPRHQVKREGSECSSIVCIASVESNCIWCKTTFAGVTFHSESCTRRSPYGYLSSPPPTALPTSPFKRRRLKEGPSTECRNKGRPHSEADLYVHGFIVNIISLTSHSDSCVCIVRTHNPVILSFV